LEQEPRAPARRVALLAARHVARAHHAVLAAAAPARADADAALRRAREAAAVLGVGEQALDLRRLVARADAQVGSDRERIDHLAGFHLPVGVPDRLDLAERLDQLRPVHLLDQGGLRLPVAVLARDRAAVLHDEIGGLVQEALPVLQAVLGPQVEIDAA